ncbi:vWA domain-containing protein [Subtercola sp. YIM 133946]|uniref:vWA domain-containing protein n=1 Tax=Subtercola sp. YIM 133946 TaxID=3118909 RepID=UPI002F941A2B
MARRRTLRPLARRPKKLDADPTVFEAKAGSGGPVFRAAKPGAAGPKATTRGSADPTATDDEGELELATAGELPADSAARALARQITARLAIPRPRQNGGARRGSGTLASLPYRGGSDEIDLDKTLELLAEHPVPDDDDIIVRERVRTRRSVVLAVDVSGSMKGDRLQSAAATVGAVAAELQHDALAVIAFWSDAAVLLNLGQPVKPMQLLDTILRMPARGLTNVSFPLELAARQLARVPVRDARVILLSDCVHNAGPDPRIAASRLPRLDVLIDVSTEKDVELGRELAAAGHGTARQIRTYRDVAPALTAIFHS